MYTYDFEPYVMLSTYCSCKKILQWNTVSSTQDLRKRTLEESQN